MKTYTEIIERPTADLTVSSRNARTHSKAQVRQIAISIKEFGFTNPVLIAEDDEIIAGHGRVEAAALLGLATVPTICLRDLSPQQRRAYMLADNKLAMNSGWNDEILLTELEGLVHLSFDVELTGFSSAELDVVFDSPFAGEGDAEAGDAVPPVPVKPVTRPGDLWQLGPHRLLCGDAQDPPSFERLLGGETADLVFTDPPYNMGSATRGKAKVKHRQFAMAAGEMSPEAFTSFLTSSLGHCALHARDGAIAFVCMDWRHMGEMLSAGHEVFSKLKNLCVWNKSAGGMGKFYRSKHELIFVFKVGTAPHTNNFGMGGNGRYRTNVWDYPGVTGSEGREQLRQHPTVKPVGMVRDAIKDCSRIGDIILDPFSGSGTTLIAAEQCRRKARLIELDPTYCDVTIQRYLSMFEGDAVDDRGATFASRASQGASRHLGAAR